MRAIFVAAGIAAYGFFFATFLYLIGFLANLPWVTPTVDRGPDAPLAIALIIDVALIALFGIQHSVMARQGFKRAWTRIVPEPLERSVYVTASSLVLCILFLLWRPITAPVWSVGGPAAYVVWAIFGLGWAIVLLSTFLLNHFELFGLQQVWLNARGKGAAAPQLRQPLFYKIVRHPLYSGFVIAFWATPVMTAGHLLLSAGMTVYIVIAIRHEERDLIGVFGEDYEAYRRNVGSLTPKLRRG